MTLGIAMTLTDGVLLVVDGRLTWPMIAGAPPNDNVNKIHRLAENVAAISFGVVQATDIALHQLESLLPSAFSIDEVRLHVDSSVSAGWRYLMTHLAPDVDRNHPKMRAALIVGGLVGNQPFIAGAIDRPDGRDPAITRTDKFNFYMLGGEEQHARDFFATKAGEAVRNFETKQGTGIVNGLVNALINSAKETIRFVEAQEPDVGGIIHYAVIRKNFPYTTGQL